MSAPFPPEMRRLGAEVAKLIGHDVAVMHVGDGDRWFRVVVTSGPQCGRRVEVSATATEGIMGGVEMLAQIVARSLARARHRPEVG